MRLELYTSFFAMAMKYRGILTISLQTETIQLSAGCFLQAPLACIFLLLLRSCLYWISSLHLKDGNHFLNSGIDQCD